MKAWVYPVPSFLWRVRVFVLLFVVVGWSFSEHQWNGIIRLRHYEHRKPTTVLASLAVISTASKHLHNNLAKAIETLEQKKPALFQQDGGAMLIAIVLDRPLMEAQALVETTRKRIYLGANATNHTRGL